MGLPSTTMRCCLIWVSLPFLSHLVLFHPPYFNPWITSYVTTHRPFCSSVSGLCSLQPQDLCICCPFPERPFLTLFALSVLLMLHVSTGRLCYWTALPGHSSKVGASHVCPLYPELFLHGASHQLHLNVHFVVVHFSALLWVF